MESTTFWLLIFYVFVAGAVLCVLVLYKLLTRAVYSDEKAQDTAVHEENSLLLKP